MSKYNGSHLLLGVCQLLGFNCKHFLWFPRLKFVITSRQHSVYNSCEKVLLMFLITQQVESLLIWIHHQFVFVVIMVHCVQFLFLWDRIIAFGIIIKLINLQFQDICSPVLVIPSAISLASKSPMFPSLATILLVWVLFFFLACLTY